MSAIEFFSQPVWLRFGLSLVHFLWQGLIIALLVGLHIRVFKISHSNSRYIIYLLAFIMMASCPLLTYIIIDTPAEAVSGAQPNPADSIKPVITKIDMPSSRSVDLSKVNTTNTSVSHPSPYIDSFSFNKAFSKYLPWILMSWIAGVLILGLRLVMGFIGIHRWCRYLEPLPQNLINRVSKLGKRLKLHCFPGIYVSPFVLQAMAIGFLKPKILLPAAMVMQMQPEMLEAVIAHELAHIRRFDLWINLVQRVAEILLFYHPAVWWLSNKIRGEREMCCDELAVKAINNRMIYATALEYAGKSRLMVKQPVLAAGLGDTNKPTLNRVRHILDFCPSQCHCRFWLAGIVVILLLTAMAIPAALALSAGKNDNPVISYLEIKDVNFEPVHQGKNIVHINVQNTSGEDRIYRVNIYSRSPDYGQKGVGWGTSFFDTIRSGEIKSLRFVYKIQGSVTDSTYVQLTHYDMGPASAFNLIKWRQSNEQSKSFKKVTYTIADLKKEVQHGSIQTNASQENTKEVIAKLEQIQQYMKNKEYKQVWESFTQDYQDAEFQLRVDAFERFEKAMEPEHPLDSAFVWEKDDFLKLKPKGVYERNGVLTLEALCDDLVWTIDFAKQDNQLKIDWISGYIPRILSMQNWQETLLPKLKVRKTEHFDIYYFEDSTASKEIEQIAAVKEKGYNEICKFLDITPEIRIRLVLFEDQQKKLMETGHQGNGWAFGNTIVEVYNDKTKLDPYHETTHILMMSFGNPPALFNEGFAVYMSERLSAESLKYLSGDDLTIYERTAQLKADNELWDLKELMGFNEIGSLETKPPVAYPQAASFVKFLIDTYGREKFLDAYKTLINGSDREQNIEKLEKIYDKPFQELEKQWADTIKN